MVRWRLQPATTTGDASQLSLLLLAVAVSTTGSPVGPADPFVHLEPQMRALEEIDLDDFMKVASKISGQPLEIFDQYTTNLNDVFPSSEFDEDDEDLIDDAIDALSADLLRPRPPSPLDNADERQLRGLVLRKRFTVEFNGMQVSYPTYVRLTRLQAKVIKLHGMIRALHAHYTEDQLELLPQYQRLMAIYQSLKPLLPEEYRVEGEDYGSIESVAGFAAPQSSTATDGHVTNKRSPFVGVDFMGIKVSYPQYLRLKKLQEKVIKLDIILRTMMTRFPPEQLEQIPRWDTLISLHRSLRKLLPPEYLAKYADARATKIFDEDSRIGLAADGDIWDAVADDEEDDDRRIKRAANFNGMSVTAGEYGRLMSMQQKALKLDAVMRQMLAQMGRDELEKEPKWHQLVSLRRSLQKLMPEGSPSALKKRSGVTMDFNGVQVSYPTYLHLVGLQKKVRKLDAVMDRIRSLKSAEELESLPQWAKLQALRESLTRLLPN